MNKNYLLVLSSFFFSFIFLDLLYSSYNNSKLSEIIFPDKNYEYSFKKNLHSYTKFGPFFKKICTDNNGFRTSCENKNNNLKNFKIAIIGDSFIEGIGLEYQQTLHGILEKKLNINIANLAVRSYSPIIYFEKINFLLKNNYKFDHIIVFIDISDIEDEFVRNNQINIKKVNLTNNSYQNLYKILTDKLQISYNLYFYLKNLFKKIFKIKPIDYFKDFDAYNYNYQRGSWTYDNKNKFKIKGLENANYSMKKLANLLNSKKIDFSIAVYPWPQQLLFDQSDSIQVKIWENFCQLYKCKNFFNFFKDFFDLKDKYGIKYVLDKYYFYPDVHFSKESQLILANQILSKF